MVDIKEPAPSKLMSMPTVTCKCGNIIWEAGIILKRFNLDGKDVNVPIEVFLCNRCKSVLQDETPVYKNPISVFS